MRNRKEKIDSLHRYFKRKKYLSILLALFTLGVNIFAWFAFSANAGLELDGTVASWNVEFKDSDEVITRDIVVEVTNMKPGMPDFNKSIEIESKSDVTANFSYQVLAYSLLGRTVNIHNKGNIITYLRDFYPFSIRLSSDKQVLNYHDIATFSLDVVWPYDSETPLYYGQDEVYDYNQTFYYFTKSGNTYTPSTVTDANYSSLKSNLYLEKDDADSYFGMMCDEYEKTSGAPCLILNVRLLVEQAN